MKHNYFDHLQNPVFITDKNGEVLYFNFVCSLFFKLPPRKLKSIKNISDLIKTDNYNVISEIKKIIESKVPGVSPEISFELNEIKFTVTLKLIPFGDELLIHIQDFSIEKHLHEKYKQQIIELKQTHEQIVKSDKLTALGELIAGVSHEISSPLTVASDKLLSISENLHQKKYELVSTDLNDLQDEFSRIKQIVSNMQSMAKNREEDLCVLNLSDVVSSSLCFVKDLGIMENVEVNFIEDNSFVLGNEGKLQQVLINLLKNSVDALDNVAKKKISIEIQNNGQVVSLHLIDNGHGIKNPDEIFEMFFTTKEYGEGTGLGLAISQKIMQSFHGQITTIKNDGGAHFHLELPKLDLECFTSTNRYLLGECEYEDPKIIVYSSDSPQLDSIYQIFKNEKVVLILTSDSDAFEDLCDSYMVDYAFSFDAKVKTEEYEYCVLNGDDEQDSIELIKRMVS
jgi:signal transduction histidine kinase